MKINKNIIKNSTITAFAAVVLLFLPICCSNEKPQITSSVIDRAETPQLKAINISTIISDSGITRYRITTPEWYIYDKAAEPYWLFPRGLHFDRFDENYDVDAQIDCNHAVYYDKIQLWVLKDSVRCTNIQGEQFETNLLNWNQREERIYSDSAISIQKKTMIINGIGFESNQMLTKYRINKVTGILPIDEDSTQMND
ncbi:MAG: LPS export ABC transporter periplasmic protein LptC [Prevotellaceae bacterium]|jgi:LPS export ABC transporter protein LptC|nr:LPS export ABC transporter periplasmic protein LptC [Prevotellaceae bacterium]